MAHLSESDSRLHDHESQFEAVNTSATFIFLVAVVAIVVAVPLAIFFYS
jgi:hypothetical protein